VQEKKLQGHELLPIQQKLVNNGHPLALPHEQWTIRDNKSPASSSATSPHMGTKVADKRDLAKGPCKMTFAIAYASLPHQDLYGPDRQL
jgi:hypothetical protein